jgi:hypothetical protein
MKAERLSLLTVIGLLAAMLIGLIHAIAEAQLCRTTRVARLFPAGWFEA